MPTVSISRYEIEQKILPPVCIVTGEPTTFAIRHYFRWLPGWVYGVSAATACIYGLVRFAFSAVGLDAPLFLLVFAVVPLLMVGSGIANAKPVACDVPIARRKRCYWTRQKAGGIIGGMMCMVLIIGGYTRSNELNWIKGEPDYGLWASRIGLVGFVIVGIVCYISKQKTIHTTEISPTQMTLANVHADFAAALAIERMLEVQREAERYEWRAASQKQKAAADLAAWKSGHPRARRVQAEEGPNAIDDEQILLKSAEDELRVDPHRSDDPPADPADRPTPT